MSADEIVAAATNLENMIMAFGTVGMFLTVLALSLPFAKRDQLAGRLKAVAARREELRQMVHAQAAERRKKVPAKQDAVAFMNKVLGSLNLRAQIESRDLRMRLAQAGWRGQTPAITFVFSRLLLPIVLALVAALLLMVMGLFKQQFSTQLLGEAAAAGAGYYLPNVMVKNAATKRQEGITLGFPDTLDLMIICVEAGLSLEAAFTRVANEIGEQNPDLAEELGLTTAELSFLGDRRAALMNFSDRVGTPEARALSTTLIQSEQYGTPLTVSLRVLSQENRDSRMSKAEQKAGALPAMLTGPMIVFFLPTVFIVLLGPAILQIMAL